VFKIKRNIDKTQDSKLLESGRWLDYVPVGGK